jgi:ankyrin repeat protein
MVAAQEGNSEAVKVLLERGANVNLKADNGATALMKACFRRGNAPVVKLLLEKGADIKAAANGGGTAWIVANVGGDKKILEMLESKGAD